jgi:hypothetical protein
MATNRTHILLRIHDTMCNGSARSFAPCPHSFLTILLGGVETVTIHFLFRTNKGGLALRVDAVFANVVVRRRRDACPRGCSNGAVIVPLLR